MKQINICLDRLFQNKKPLRAKWQARKIEDNDINKIYLYHYQHLILIYDIDNNKSLYQWHECPTDKRGLDAALEYFANIK